MRCRYSNHSYDRTTRNNRIVEVQVDRVSPKEKIPYKADGVVCPGCGRHIAIRKHPNSGNTYVIIPAHNAPEGALK